MSVTIEMVGLCGAGKTTLAAKLAPHLESTGLRLFSRPQPSGFAALSTAAYLAARMLGARPGKTTRLLADPTGRQLVAKLGYRMAGLKYKTAHPTLISESGVVQPIISFEAQNNYAAAPIPLNTIMSQLPCPEVLVRVDLAPEIAFERYSRRESVLGPKIEGTLDMFSRAHIMLDDVCRFHAEKHGKIIIFSSTTIDDDAVVMLAEKLRAATAAHRPKTQ